MQLEEFMPQSEVDKAAQFLELIKKSKSEMLALAEALKGGPGTPGKPNTSTPKPTVDAAQEAYNKELAKRQRLEAQLTETVKKAAAENKNLRREVQLQTREAAANANTIEGLRTRVARLTDTWKNTVRGTREYKTALKELSAAQKELSKEERAAGIFGRNVGNYPKLLSSLKGIAAGFLSIRAGYQVLKNATQTIVEFEQANANLATILGKNKNEISNLTQSAKDLGATTEWTASQVTQLQTELAKLGFNEAEIRNMQRSALSFATAMGADLAPAAALAGSALRAFGLDSTETERVVDVMTVGANRSALSFSYLETALSHIAPVARTFGFGIEDTIALLGMLANSGFEASSAATASRNILLNLADANGKLAKTLGQPVRSIGDMITAFKDLDERGIDLATTLELTDKRSVAAFNTFLHGTDSLAGLRNALDGINGESLRVASERLDTVQGSTKLMASAWESLMLSFSNSTGFMKSVIDGITSVINGVNKLVNSGKMLGEQLNTNIRDFVSLEEKVKPLVTRYEELRFKTSYTKEEHDELQSVMQQITALIPGVVSKFDEYGNVLDIDTEKVNKFIEAQRAMLNVQNADEIRKVTKELGKLKKEQERQTALSEAGGTTRTIGVSTSGAPQASYFQPFSSERLREMDNAIEERRKKILGYETLLSNLTGQTVEQRIKDEREAADKEREVKARREAMSKQFYEFNKTQLDNWINDTANANSEYLKLARETYTLRFGGNVDAGGDTDSSDKERERRRKLMAAIASDNRKAQDKLAEDNLDMWAQSNKEIADDETQSLLVRTVALREYYDTQKKLAIEAAGNQRENIIQGAIDKAGVDDKGNPLLSRLEAEQAVAPQIEALRIALGIRLNDYDAKFAEDSLKIEDDAIQKAIEAQKRAAVERENQIALDESNELTALSEAYKNRELTQKEYEDERLRIQREYAVKRATAELKAMEDQLAALKGDTNISPEQAEWIAALEAEIAKKRVDIAVAANDIIRQDNENAWGEWADYMENLSREIERWGGVAVDILSTIASAMQNVTDKGLAELDKQQEAAEKHTEDEQERIERLAEAGAISEEQKNARIALADQQLEATQEQIEQRRIELRRRQAQYDKAASIAQAIINGALSVTAALTVPPPVGPILAALNAGLAAAQVAIIAGQPLPQYAEGTDYHKGGLAWIGDGGRSEMVITGGRMFKSPAVPTLVDLPRGAEVLPDYTTALRDMQIAAALTTIRQSDAVPAKVVASLDDKMILARLGDTNSRMHKLIELTERQNKAIERQNTGRRFKEIKDRFAFRK
jgi:TP901 family phage tail tape measure protein